jgi:hypothetical protein
MHFFEQAVLLISSTRCPEMDAGSRRLSQPSLRCVQHSLQGLYSQIGCMSGGWRHAAYGPNHVLAGNGAGLRYGLAFCQFRYRRGACHHRHTSPSPKAKVLDAIACELQRKFQDVTARGIFDTTPCGGIGQLACISRMLEVIDQLGSVHGPHYCLRNLPVFNSSNAF